MLPQVQVPGALGERQLAQSRPGNTNATAILTTTNAGSTMVTSMYVCNTTGTTATYRIFHDLDGTTYDQTTALFYDVPVAGNTTEVIDFASRGLALGSRGDALAVRTGTASALTFTAYGYTLPIAG